MEPLLATPAFRTYALCSSILALKMILSAFYTGSRRNRHQAYINREDAQTFGKAGVRAGAEEAPEVAHALRIQRNDLENIPAFFAIGLIYVFAGATARGAAAYFWVFTLARLAHTAFYMRNLQPWRAIAFGVGVLCMFGMITQILRAVL